MESIYNNNNNCFYRDRDRPPKKVNKKCIKYKEIYIFLK